MKTTDMKTFCNILAALFAAVFVLYSCYKSPDDENGTFVIDNGSDGAAEFKEEENHG